MFPVRRACALGLPVDAVAAMRSQLPDVAFTTDAGGLQRSDLLVISTAEKNVFDVVAWVRQRRREFPLLFWSESVSLQALIEECRVALFGEEWASGAASNLERLRHLEEATFAIAEGRVDAHIRNLARCASHELAGSLERHGMSAAAALAEESAELLAAGGSESGRLTTIVLALRNELSLRQLA